MSNRARIEQCDYCCAGLPFSEREWIARKNNWDWHLTFPTHEEAITGTLDFLRKMPL